MTQPPISNPKGMYARDGAPDTSLALAVAK